MITDCLLKKDPFLSDSIVGWGGNKVFSMVFIWCILQL